MNTQRTRTRYVHVNSKHRLAGDLAVNNLGNLIPEDKAIINVHMNNPIKNVWRVAVKSFTIANHFHNVKTGENTLSWYEFFKSVGTTNYVYKKFSITVPPGYYSAEELCLIINNTIDQFPPADRRILTEDPMGITFSQDTEHYNIRINLIISSGDKWFLPVVEANDVLWSYLGFTENQVTTLTTGQGEPYILGIQARLAEPDNGRLGILPSLAQAGTDQTAFNMISNLPTTIENSGGIYLTSDTLTTGSTYETRKHPDKLHTEAVPMNILEWIQFDVARYSWVHYQSNILHWHYLNEASIADFDITMRSQSGQILTHRECGNYNLVLVFETVDHDEVSAEFIRAYNKEGYNLAHRPDRVQK